MTQVALLWHMHQPYYEDLVTGEHILPWVRLHGLKDYYGMVALLREFPSVRMTFNLVPSLLVQLQAFADNRARDRHLEIGLKPAGGLTQEDRTFIAANFFHAHRVRMIEPYPRYRELFERREAARGGRASAEGWQAVARELSEGDLRDLQVWHKLAWVDPSYHEADARVRGLVAKDRGFSEDDKAVLREVELELLRRTVPEYRAAQDRGQVELSTSPFYHPILPLLCDTDIYRRTHPQSDMPRRRFQHPEDARAQLVRASDYMEKLFGRRPTGLWPSEGSVSEAVIPLARAAGFTWLATDEMILARTLNQPLARDGQGHLDRPELLYRPYRIDSHGSSVQGLFRDHTLSDLIGFTYSGWAAKDAARDFTGRLREAGRRFAARTGGGEATISVILDGENAWEHFEGGGRPFLRALYQELATDPELRTVTCAEATQSAGEFMTGLFPGSWINGDFYIWIGHADDRRAWDQLADAREVVDGSGADGPESAARARAREEILIAEGSDWFWWYGDDHSSEHDFAFDELFRRHVQNVYRTLDLPVPEELHRTNITTAAPPTLSVEAPLGLLHPTIDGRETSYFEWLGAGLYDVPTSAGAMQPARDRRPLAVTSVRFGFDLTTLYVRLDFQSPVDAHPPTLAIVLTLVEPAIRIRLDVNNRVAVSRTGVEGQGTPLPMPGAQGVFGEIAELAIPLAPLALKPGDGLRFFISIFVGGHEAERQPPDRSLEIRVPSSAFEPLHWSV